MPPQLQEGIFHAPGIRPGKAFAILFLQAVPGTEAAQVGASFRRLWRVYQGLRRGEVPDLPGQPVPAGGLTCLVGYGATAFELAGAQRPLPEELRQFGRFRSPLTAGGGLLLGGSGQIYDNDVKKNPATEVIAVQFIAETDLAVNRAVVETWKALQDDALDAGEPALQLAAFFQGFQRDDGRSWIDFHDGTSNLPSDQRHEVIVITDEVAGMDEWTIGGTYLCFMRIGVDLPVWRRLARQQQELLVGRDKMSGCPFVSVDAAGHPVAEQGCPVAGTIHVGMDGNEGFLEPADVAIGSPLAQSHVQRSSHHRQDLSAVDSLRIFRQGYEFLEPIESAPGFRAGLNFVSFQDTPQRLIRILTTPSWMGSTNFGGDPQQPLPGTDCLLAIRAAGIFLAPPVVEEEEFPGASVFFPPE